MFGYIQGFLKDAAFEKDHCEVLVRVGTDASGIGYSIKTPLHPRYQERLQTGQTVELFLYSHIREDAFDLYGFIDPFEKKIYTTLLSVSGVGPKLGLAILSSTDAAGVIRMILEEDKAALTAISGVGKKTAERMILELKDPIQKKVDTGVFSAPKSGTKNESSWMDDKLIEAFLALQALGYKEAQAKKMIEDAIRKINVKTDPVELLIKTALQA